MENIQKYVTKTKIIYEQLCEEIEKNGDFSEIFSKGNERGARYYYQHCHNIQNTYLLFFDEIGHTIQTDWKPTHQEKILCFPGNSSFEISSSVHIGFREAIQLINELVGHNASEYFIACPTYTTTREYTRQQFVDCQPVVTGKCFDGTSVETSCMEEMAGELGIVPMGYDIGIFFPIMVAKPTGVHKKLGDVHTYIIDVANCTPYDGVEIVSPTMKEHELYYQRVQIIIYGKHTDFLNCLPQVRQRTISKDFENIKAIRLIPLSSIPILYPKYFE